MSHQQSSKKISSYGSWSSPITPQQVTASSPTLTEPQFDGDTLYWLESRPNEKGRNAVVALDSDGLRRDVLPHPLNARNRVNEYGGGSYCVRHGVIYFVLYSDQRIYRLNTRDLSAIPEAITKESVLRYADLQFDLLHNQLIAVCEDHNPSLAEPLTSIVCISLASEILGKTTTLTSGNDFYSTPRLSHDGKKIAWISWNHPNMPWDSTHCCTANISENQLDNVSVVDNNGTESVCQPRWSPAGELYLISDRSDWWNIYRVRDNRLEPVCAMNAEFTSPPWVFAISNYDFLSESTLLASFTRDGLWYLAEIDIAKQKLDVIECPYTDVSYIAIKKSTVNKSAIKKSTVNNSTINKSAAQKSTKNNSTVQNSTPSHSNPTSYNSNAVFVGASSTLANGLISYNKTISNGTASTTRPIVEPRSAFSQYDLATPQPITFPVVSSTGQDASAHGFFYAPTSANNQGSATEKPPLIVFCHGGPTSAAQSALNLKIQYWTSRGFAVADVNYGGSTGYGRIYRNRLQQSWGIVDVEDVVACVDYLVTENLVDPNRVAIRGSSAGGYTVLAALTFSDRFKAGASLYGIGDLETLARDTHKFESRSLDNLVGLYPAETATYQARSPIHHVDQLSCPVIFFQGLKDTVVPPGQAEAMVNALDNKKIPVAYITFEDEAHGFRQADNIHHALEAELSFYCTVFNIVRSEPLLPLRIRHADKLSATHHLLGQR